MSRKPLSKAIRFEVFKRDRFTCQYCGRKAPDVVLEVDHIKPYSKGGKDEIINLVTACRDCNRGKTNRELDDSSAVRIQRQQLEEIQQRREQLEMVLKWREELKEETEIEADAIDSLLLTETGYSLSETGRSNIKKLIRRFGFNETYDAAVTAIDRYYDKRMPEISLETAINKIGGICYNRMKARERDAEQDT